MIKHSVRQILKSVVAGNERFMSRHSHDYFSSFKESQSPEITLLTCSDSRVQVQVLGFDAINEVFVIRNIGNQIISSFGSVDYGVLHLKTPLLVILGHTHCGAIQAVLNNYDDSPVDIIRELDHLSIPIKFHEHDEVDEEKLWLHFVQENVDYQVRLAVKKYKELVENHELTIVGMVDDFLDIYGSGEGRIIICNINNETNPQVLKAHPALMEIPGATKNLVVKRVEC